MSQYILIAALPVFIMDDLGDGQLAAGMAMTCFQIGTVCTRPIAGRIIDGVNKQKLLLISTVFFVLIMGGFLLASNLHMVYGLRLVHRHDRIGSHGGSRPSCQKKGRRYRLLCRIRKYGHGHRASRGSSDHRLVRLENALRLPLPSCDCRSHCRKQETPPGRRRQTFRRKEEGHSCERLL